MEAIRIRLPEEDIAALRRMISAGYYFNLSDAVRGMVARGLASIEAKWQGANSVDPDASSGGPEGGCDG